MASLAAPVKVSPLIKTARYAALITGLLYGSSHYKSLSKQEAIFREEEAKLAVVRNAKKAEEKLKLYEIEMGQLAEAAGIKVPSK